MRNFDTLRKGKQPYTWGTVSSRTCKNRKEGDKGKETFNKIKIVLSCTGT